jgi:hypothetical protein
MKMDRMTSLCATAARSVKRALLAEPKQKDGGARDAVRKVAVRLSARLIQVNG